MIQKKICLVGAFAVGKTSLIQRYVSSIYSDKYLTTVGVKIDKKQVVVGEKEVSLMIWDIAGEDDYTAIKPAYIRGAAGCIIVLDGTRAGTLTKAISIHEMIQKQIGAIPCVFAINKADLKEQWVLDQKQIQSLEALNHPVFLTSAKKDQGVNDLFQSLTARILSN